MLEEEDLALFCILDIIFPLGKSILDVDDISLIMHLSCTEVKDTGVKN